MAEQKDAAVASWTAQTLPLSVAGTGIWGSGPDDIYVVGGPGGIAHSGDKGKTWQIQKSGTMAWLADVWGSGPGDVYVVGEYDGGLGQDTILHTSDGGRTWVQQANSPAVMGGYLQGISGVGPEVFAVGNGGEVEHTTDGGKTWTSVRGPPAQAYDLEAVWMSGSGSAWACATEMVILHTADHGATWVEQDIGLSNGQRGIWGSGPNDIYSVGSMDTIIHSADGMTWKTIQGGWGVVGDLEDVWGSGPDDVWVVGPGVNSRGAILHSTDRGKSWLSESQPLPAPVSISAMWGSGPQDIYVVGGQLGKGFVLHRQP